jgi:hypothetical protein
LSMVSQRSGRGAIDIRRTAASRIGEQVLPSSPAVAPPAGFASARALR